MPGQSVLDAPLIFPWPPVPVPLLPLPLPLPLPSRARSSSDPWPRRLGVGGLVLGEDLLVEVAVVLVAVGVFVRVRLADVADVVVAGRAEVAGAVASLEAPDVVGRAVGAETSSEGSMDRPS